MGMTKEPTLVGIGGAEHGWRMSVKKRRLGSSPELPPTVTAGSGEERLPPSSPPPRLVIKLPMRRKLGVSDTTTASEEEMSGQPPRRPLIIRLPLRQRKVGVSDATTTAEVEEETDGQPPRRPLIIRLPVRRQKVGVSDTTRTTTTTTEETSGQPPRRPLIIRSPLGQRKVGDIPLGQKRLVLVLDLDHTLLHSTRISHLSPGEVYLLQQLCPVGGEGRRSGDRSLLFGTSSSRRLLTKLRPFVHTFLREVSTMYHLCVCTMGNQAYGNMMVKLLDPDGVYFSPRDIVTRSNFTEKGQKGLDVVRYGDDRTTLILDDTESVWEKHGDNLIRMPPYHYFSGSRRHLGDTWRSPSELREDEDELTGSLSTTLHLLRQVHWRFFDPRSGGDLSTRDVREILKDLRKKLEPSRRVEAVPGRRWWI